MHDLSRWQAYLRHILTALPKLAWVRSTVKRAFIPLQLRISTGRYSWSNQWQSHTSVGGHWGTVHHPASLRHWYKHKPYIRSVHSIPSCHYGKLTRGQSCLAKRGHRNFTEGSKMDKRSRNPDSGGPSIWTMIWSWPRRSPLQLI